MLPSDNCASVQHSHSLVFLFFLLNSHFILMNKRYIHKTQHQIQNRA